MGFSNQYFLALLCVKLTFCGPVSNLVDYYEKGVNHDCKVFPVPQNASASLPMCESSVTDFKDPKKVTNSLKYDPIPLMCYSAMSNMMTLCPVDESQGLNFTKPTNTDINTINSVSVDKFCGEAANVSVNYCEEVPKDDKPDCELLTKVSTILTNKKKCEKHCIVDEDEEIEPVCKYLYFSMQALSYFYNENQGVFKKSTEKSVNPDMPIPPIANETKSSTTESQKKPDPKLTTEEKQDTDNKVVENNAQADKQVQKDDVKKEPTLPVESPNQTKTEPDESPNKTKPEQGGGGGEPFEPFEYAEEIPENHDGHPFSGQKESYSGISENTMKNGKTPVDDSSSSFFSYFILLSIVAIVAYLVFHNKQKILALILEGRRGRQGSRRRSGGKEYRKLDSNLEDTMNTESFTSGQHVIY